MADSFPIVRGVEFQATGLSIAGEMSVAEWEDLGQYIARAEAGVQWWVGDWLLYGEGRKAEWGSMYDEAMERTGYEQKTLRNQKYVAGQFQLSRRRDNLTWKHHAEVAALPEAEQDQWLDKAEAKGLSAGQLRSAIRKRAWLSEAEKAKTRIVDGVYCGDFRQLSAELQPRSSALVFTDPPYDEESIPLFDDLGKMASRVLVDGGSLITFCPQYALDQVLGLLAGHLKFLWICCCEHTGNVAQMSYIGIKVHWKPLLWLVKGGGRRDRETWTEDLIVSEQQKSYHKWQQSTIEAEYFIEKLTIDGELICDPFCGGGTTAVAAKRLGRKFWTCDIDEAAYRIAAGRLHDEKMEGPDRM